MAYDADGNVTGDGLNQYVYDAENRLCATYNYTTTAVTGYVYDGDSNRVIKGTLSGQSLSLTSTPAISPPILSVRRTSQMKRLWRCI